MNTFLLIIVAIIWGSTFFIIKETIATTNEFILVFGRTILAAIFLFLYLFFKKKEPLFNKNSILNGLILGTLLAITYCSQAIGIKYTSSGHSAFITGTGVIVVPVILVLFFKYQLLSIHKYSISIVFIGLFLLTYHPKFKLNPGDTITLITTMSYAFHIIFSGRFVKSTPVIPLIAYQFLFAAIFSLSIFLITDTNFKFPDTKSTWAIIYLGLIGTLFCYFVSVWVQQYVSSIKVAITFSLEPIFAVLFGYIMLGELLSFKEIVGAFLILSGIILYNIKKKAHSIQFP